jgi:digalactosyldiacylglycerol synthase
LEGGCSRTQGYDELLELAKHYDTSVVTAGAPKMHWDIFGSGPDLPAIQARAALYRLDAAFLGARDHLDPSIRAYRCFVNPSLSDVVATTTAEALAMGKWVVVAKHPENDFFSSFANCLIYTSVRPSLTAIAS